MQMQRVLVIVLIYTQPVLPSLISTNSLRREISNLFKKTNNNNNEGGILTQKGRKIQLTPDGNFIICGIDSLQDDYYGCQSSNEVYIYKTYRTRKTVNWKQLSMAATKGSSVKKKENTVPKFSSASALTPLTKPTVTMTYAPTRQADLFGPRASNKLIDYLDTVRPSRSLFKNTSSSTTPIFATSAETRHPLRPSLNTAPTSIVGNLIKLQSRITSIPKATTLTLKSKPTVKMAYQASTRQADLFSPRAADKQFDYFNTVRPNRSLFKNTKSSSTTPIFATSAETRHPLRPSSKTASISNIGNLIKLQSRIISIPRTTTPTPKTKPTIMLAYYVAADKLSDYLDTVSPSRSLFKRAKSRTTPIFATRAETRNPVRTNSKTAPTNNVSNLVKLDSSILPILRTLTNESNMPIETPARGTSHMPSTRSIVWRADTQPAIKHLFNY